MSRQDGSTRRTSDASADDSAATILHIDMDAFFAAVELLERPELRGTPVIVGGSSGRGVVTSATYEARRFGVRSAMPMAQALRLCPQATVIGGHMEKYAHWSKVVMGIFRDVTPLVEPLSIDEAFLDVAGARGLFGPPAEIGAMIRRRVHAETGLTCSVGAASTKFVAKLASTRCKPDGLLVVPAAETLPFLHALPVGALWGVGRTTEEALVRRGLRTVADIADTPLPALQSMLGESAGARLHDLSWGRDPRRVSTHREEKSMGHENTFHDDVTDPEIIRRELLGQATRVAERLRRAGLTARTVSLKLRYSDFRTITRSRTLSEPTDVARRIYDEIRDVYEQVARPGDRIRLVGVRAEQLDDADSRPVALWDVDEGWREAERTVDQAAQRFGRGAIGPASLLRRPGAKGATVSDPRTEAAARGILPGHPPD
ncbi:DNA polymerase IV [Clavibacter michiganensis]|uniref:DNA polymerase IV n=1 Tax=Clavibacter michiganensis TaxID=28447 RepID=A0A2S5VYT3_9MICO|nr:DNA polymerase IV [Clavibacter michiganensis]PPF71367.1 DNA polymerase IV [Clavibacter michiganensis]